MLEKTREFKNKYKWGEEFAYSISGAYSIEQAMVMDWLTDKFYSPSNIISALENRIAAKSIDTSVLRKFPDNLSTSRGIMIGAERVYP